MIKHNWLRYGDAKPNHSAYNFIIRFWKPVQGKGCKQVDFLSSRDITLIVRTIEN